jgi:hypothetical protein
MLFIILILVNDAFGSGEEYNENHWSVNSQYPNANNHGNPPANLLDNNPNSMWNAGGRTQHYNDWYVILTYTGGDSVWVNEVDVGTWADGRCPCGAKVYVSSDLDTWNLASSFTVPRPDSRNAQAFPFDQGVTGKYFKFVITNTRQGYQPYLTTVHFKGVLTSCTDQDGSSKALEKLDEIYCLCDEYSAEGWTWSRNKLSNGLVDKIQSLHDMDTTAQNGRRFMERWNKRLAFAIFLHATNDDTTKDNIYYHRRVWRKICGSLEGRRGQFRSKMRTWASRIDQEDF